MANETHEPRALSAALAGPAFATRGAGVAMHAANRHVERWAPEASAGKHRQLRSLGFVDRLIAPWIETAQRSASLRLFSQYAADGASERPPSAVSWVFPRPWYQDELDWMAAARQAPPDTARALLTTRGTYVAPDAQRASAAALPASLYEYVAPSLSVAAPQAVAGVGHGGESLRADAYSPLVSLAAVHAAEVMARAVTPTLAGPSARMTPALRAVLSTMLERAAAPREVEPTRLAMQAPTLVTPPAPRADEVPGSGEQTSAQRSAVELAERYAEQRAQIAQVQRIARQSAERELATRAAANQPTGTTDVREQATRAEAELRERAAATRSEQVGRQLEAERTRQAETTQRTAVQRLHEQARAEAAEHARASLEPRAAAPIGEPSAPPVRRAPAEVAAAIAALPAELAAFIGQRPEALGELNEALRAVELLARGAASGVTMEATRGPRMMMPAGLGGLVAAVDRAHLIAEQPGALAGDRPGRAPVLHPAAQARALRVPAMRFLDAPPARSIPTGALEAATTASPAALSHVAWADRWLARFAGASPQSLDTLAASAGPSRLQALADAAPGSVFVAPMIDTARTGDSAGQGSRAAAPEVVRYADDAETPDDVFAAISAAATRKRSAAVVTPGAPAFAEPAAASFERLTAADAVAQASPAAPGAGFAAQLASSPFAPALRHVLPVPAAASFDVRALFGSGLSATYLAGLLGSSADEIDIATRRTPSWDAPAADQLAAAERAVPAWDPTYVAPDAAEVGDAIDQASAGTPVSTRQPELAPLTTLRTALLSWDVHAQDGVDVFAPAASPTTTTSAPITTATARTMLEAMSLPMLGDTADGSAAWTSPGMIADRAHSWSVAQERSTSDLALDFVPPELVLAARVYGLGPAEAAQAARLALAGPGQLTAMAGAVDRTFVQAMAIDADRRERLAGRGGDRAIETAYPTQPGELVAMARPATSESAREPATQGTAFGIDRRSPRGAFLWPSATVAALGLSAAAYDGDQSMSVAALELLAAQAVAELGTFAALGVGAPEEVLAARGGHGAELSPGGGAAVEPAEADVLGAAASLVPASRRARFDALYVALSQSTAGRSVSPAARAARALALAGRGEDGAITARERAATAWDVLPVVYAAAGSEDEPTAASDGTGRPAAHRGAHAHRGELVYPDAGFAVDRPGLGALSARAGEALGSYVTPAAPTFAGAPTATPSMREPGAVLRAPTAAQELVRTGRPAGRHGGGEVEIPSWFEAAARKMLEERSGSSEGISLAELTLVTAAPSAHVAASTRSVPTAAPLSPGINSQASQSAGAPQIDIEKVANEIYRHILVLMDVARARNGEPYL